MLASNNTTNTIANMTSVTLGNTISTGIYSMGNYYNWYSATAGTGTYSISTSNISVTSDICPKSWRLARGGNNQNTANNDYLALSEAIIGSKPASYDSDTYSFYNGTPEGTNASKKLRTYPNNFIYSGYAYGSSFNHRGSNGHFWSSTGLFNMNGAHKFSINVSSVEPTSTSSKYNGLTARCVFGS